MGVVCKECGTELLEDDNLRKHQSFHKEPAWLEQGYVDPSNSDFPLISNLTNSRLTYALSSGLGRNVLNLKRRKRNQVNAIRRNHDLQLQFRCAVFDARMLFPE